MGGADTGCRLPRCAATDLHRKFLQKNRVQGLTWFCCRSGGPWCASEPANGLRPPTGRPRAAAGAVARPTGTANAGSKTCRNVLSHNQCYTYRMTTATGRRPCRTLGDQQLLDQTRRLAANQRSLEVHILDHLDEIDRRSLALRRGFSSLFDYAVHESIYKYCNGLLVVPVSRYCFRNPSVISDHSLIRFGLASGRARRWPS